MLWALKDAELIRFRCRVGHAYTSETLTHEQTRIVEHALWTAMRALEEQAAVRRRMATRAREMGHEMSADRCQNQAHELDKQAQQVRNLVLAGVGPAPEEGDPTVAEDSSATS